MQIKVRGNVYEFELYRQVFGDSYMVSFGRTPGEAYEQAALSPTFLKDEAIFLSGKAAGVAETYAAFSRGFLTQEQRRKLEAAKLSAFYASNFTDAYLFLLKVADALLEETKCPLQLLNTLSREEVESLTGGSR